MRNQLEIEIIKILIDQSDFMSAQQLAYMLHISRRTVFNTMNKVRELCEEYSAQLISQKAKGFKLKNTYQLSIFIKKQNKKCMHVSKLENKLYIAYLLLNEDTPIHISELEEIMYLSRPTIYKLIDELKEWFGKSDVETEITRKGVAINCGERRYRIILKNWIIDTEKLFKEKEEKQDNSDFFKLKRELRKYRYEKYSVLYQCIEAICKGCKIRCLMKEIETLSVLLEVMIYRIQNEYYVKDSSRLFNIITNLYSADKVEEIANMLNQVLGFSFPQREVIFLIANILIVGDFEEHSILNNRIKEIEVKKQLMHDIQDYISANLNINHQNMCEVLADIEYIIKREEVFLIKGSGGRSEEDYDLIMNRFHTIRIYAQNILYMISQYYHIVFWEKMICNLIFVLLQSIQESKKNLSAVLFHNCDEFEYKYVFSNLQRLSFVTVIYATDRTQEFDKIAESDDIDLIFSTVNFKSDKMDVIEISKVFGNIEFIEVMNKINKKYEEKNFKALNKNPHILKLLDDDKVNETDKDGEMCLDLK